MTLDCIWEEVKNTYGAVSLGNTNEVGGTKAYIYKGVKIKKTTDTIIILNTKRKGDYYEEINFSQYEAFFMHGLKYGAYNVLTDNYQESLDRVSSKIQEEINIRNNMKHFMALKEMRVTLIKKYTDANKIKLELLT